MEQLREKVKALRKKRGWAQEDLAREIEVSLSTVQRWEAKGANPTRLARRELKRLFKEAGIESVEELDRLEVLNQVTIILALGETHSEPVAR